MAGPRSASRLAKHFQRELLRSILGEENLPKDPEDLPVVREDDSIERLLARAPWLRDEVKAGRVSLSAQGNTIRFHYAASYFLHQADLMSRNVNGLPTASARTFMATTYAGYRPNQEDPAAQDHNRQWAEGKARIYADRLATAMTKPAPASNFERPVALTFTPQHKL